MGWGSYALDVGTDIQFTSSMFNTNLTNNIDLADENDTFAYLGTTNYSRPILAVQDGDEFIYAGYISAVHVGISLVVSLVLFISYECGKFTKESLCDQNSKLCAGIREVETLQEEQR